MNLRQFATRVRAVERAALGPLPAAALIGASLIVGSALFIAEGALAQQPATAPQTAPIVPAPLAPATPPANPQKQPNVPAPSPAPEAKSTEDVPPPPGPAGGTQPAPDAAEAPEVDPDMKRVAACKEDALTKLKQRSPSIEDIYIDIDGLTVAESNGKLGNTPVKGVIMGEAYIQRDRSDEANRFLCLTGEKGDVLFTFFTER